MMVPILVAALAALEPAQGDPIAYTVSLEGAPGAIERLGVELRFSGEYDGETRLRLPIGWAGEGELWRGVEGLEAVGARLEAEESHPAFYRLHHFPGAEITVRYRLVESAPPVVRDTHDNPHRPLVRDAYVHAVGSTLFAALVGEDGAYIERPVTLALEPDPGLTLVSDAEHAAGIAALRQSVVFGGDVEVRRLSGADADVRLAWRRAPSADTEGLADAALAAMEAVNAFFGEAPDVYLATLLPVEVEPGVTSLGGTGLGDAFAFFIGGDPGPSRTGHFLRHEYLHSWIPGRFGAAPDGPDTWAREAWFSEGFTDFYAWRLGVRSGALDEDAALAALNRVLARYGENPEAGRRASSLTAEEFWSDPDIDQLVYQRGFLTALTLDHAVREASGGTADLDTVMKNGLAEPSADLTGAAHVLQIAEFSFDAPASTLANALQERGEPARLPADVLAACGTLRTRGGAQQLAPQPGRDPAACRAQMAGTFANPD